MKRNGMYALDFHGPALVGGRLTYLRGSQFANRVVALCFLPPGRRVSAERIDRQAHQFGEIGADLVLVTAGAQALHRWWPGERGQPVTPILADICGRLHRSFGVPLNEPVQRCQTFVIDRAGILRLRVNHDFIWQDFTVLGGTIAATRHAAAQACCSEAESMAAGAVSFPA